MRELARQVPMKPTSRSQIAFVQSALLFFSFAVDDVAPFANYLEDILSPAFALQIANEEVRLVTHIHRFPRLIISSEGNS